MLQAPSPSAAGRAIFALRRFVYPQKELCEFCRASLADQHAHLLEAANRTLYCVCRDCADVGGEKYLFVPPRKQKLGHFELSDAQWGAFQIPIDLAFLVRRADGRCEAHYPGPAGVIRAAVSTDAWIDLAVLNPVVADILAEVEALLIDRIAGRRNAYRVSIDHCYALAGIIRSHWRGLSGGGEVWDRIESYLAAADAPETGHA
jgi:Family of unknown function (DUF5947)